LGEPLIYMKISISYMNREPTSTIRARRLRARPSCAPALIAAVPDELVSALAANGARSWPKVEEMLKTVRPASG